MSATLLVEKNLANNVYSVTFRIVNVSNQEQLVLEGFGEPSYTFGGTFDPAATSFLQAYFPNAPALIPDWEEFTGYTSGDQVQFTDGNYYQALQTFDFDDLTDWAAFESAAPPWSSSASYTTGDIVYFGGVFYEALVDAPTSSPPAAPNVAPTEWSFRSQGGPVRMYTDGKAYKAISAIDFDQFPNWAAGTQYTADDVVEFVDAKFYKSIQDSPATWDNTITYGLGNLVNFGGTFYEATAASPTIGTDITLTLSGITGTFTVGDTVEQATGSSPETYRSGEVLSVTGSQIVVRHANPADPFVTGTDITVNRLLSPNTATASVTTVTVPNPSNNTAQWSTTVKADPITDDGNYWELYEDQEPTKDGGFYWEEFTDRDPAVSGSTYWVAFVPTGQAPNSTTSFAVNQIIRALPSGLPFTFNFTGTNAEANADDFATISAVDIEQVWNNHMTNVDTFTETLVVVFS